MDLSSQEIEESCTMVDGAEKASLLLQNVIRPTILKELAGGKSCSIFRIRQTVTQTNDTTYAPKILSIGPYHHGTDKQHLQMIEEHKQLYLQSFVSETQKNGVGLSDLVNVVGGLEEKIRDSYSETLPLDKQELIDLMVLDGCFILLLFLVVSSKIQHKASQDPIFMLRWILPTIRSDLLLLENQVPLFLLKDLLETSKLAPSTSLNMLAFNFFNYSIKKPKEFWEKHNDIGAYHLLDLIRKTFIPTGSSPITQSQCYCCIYIFCGPWDYSGTETPITTCLDKICCSKERTEAGISWSPPPPPPRPRPRPFLGPIVSAKKLQKRGIKFKLRENVDTPLDICFKNGVLLEIPLLSFDEFISSLISNIVAFEQFNVTRSTEMTSYVIFMSCLTSGEKDAVFLCEKGIIQNYGGSIEEVTLFFRNVVKDLTFDISKSYLATVFEGVNKYKKRKIPWKTLSSSAAVILLLLTLAQTFFAALTYFRPPKN